MTREVELVSYLPPFMAEYQEIGAALTAENPEFALVWKAADRALKNEFIDTADEYGIGRFEKLLGIFPSGEDTLEGRRARVRSRWFNALPYTIRMLLKKLQIVCQDTDFVLEYDFESGYTLRLDTKLERFGGVDEAEKVLDAVVPCGIRIEGRNRIDANAGGTGYFAGAVSWAEIIVISD